MLGEELSKARAEIAHLRAELHEANAACDAQVRECNRMRAENVSLRDGNNEMIDHNAVLSAEIERLRDRNKVLEECIAVCQKDILRLRAEVAKAESELCTTMVEKLKADMPGWFV